MSTYYSTHCKTYMGKSPHKGQNNALKMKPYIELNAYPIKDSS